MTSPSSQPAQPTHPLEAPVSRIVNPSAVGNPDEVPIVEFDDALVRFLRPCRAVLPDGVWCGGVNGWHDPACPAPDGSAR